MTEEKKDDVPLWKQAERVEQQRLRGLIVQLTPTVPQSLINVDQRDAFTALAAFTCQAMLAGLTAKAKLNAVIALLQDAEHVDDRAISEECTVQLRKIHDEIVVQVTSPTILTASSVSEARR